MTIQRKFMSFHNRIQLADEDAAPRQQRDLVLDRLRAGLAARGLPPFTMFVEGSLATGTAVQPVDRELDIDVGVVFTGPRPDNPLEARRWVRAALAAAPSASPAARVECCRRCLSVALEPGHHVDLAVYWEEPTGQLALAVGREDVPTVDRAWQPCDPRALVTRVRDHLQGEDRRQFRRVVRYLRRWRDVQFPPDDDCSPLGAGLTVLALEHFRPVGNRYANSPALYDDLAATRGLVDALLHNFRPVWSAGRRVDRIEARVPVAPFDDVLAGLADPQMDQFRRCLVLLAAHLDEVVRHNDADYLIAAFGEDFPVE